MTITCYWPKSSQNLNMTQKMTELIDVVGQMTHIDRTYHCFDKPQASEKSRPEPFGPSHLGHRSTWDKELVEQVASGIRELVINELNKWTIVEPLDTIAHDPLFHHDKHYTRNCGPLIAVHNVPPTIVCIPMGHGFFF